MLLSWLIACKDPALVPFADALSTWEAGRARLDAGDPTGAATRFAEARTHDGQSPALVLWEAKARADAGDLDAAVGLLDGALARDGALALAQYNRAAYRARQGRLAEAAADLRAAIGAGVASPYGAAADPDFAPHRADPAFSGLLPEKPAVGRVRGPEGAVWIGSTVEVSLLIESLATSSLSLRREGADPGCLSLDRVVEDDVEQADVRLRELTLRLLARGPCTATLGPFVITAEGVEVPVGPVTVVVEAPPGTAPAAPTPLPTEIPVPSTLAPTDAGVRTEHAAGGTTALGPLDTVLSAAGQKPAYGIEWRMGGQTRATGGFWPGTVEVSARKRAGARSAEGG